MKEGKAPLGGDVYGKFRKRQKLAKIVYHVCQTFEENGQASLMSHFALSPHFRIRLCSLCARAKPEGDVHFFFFLIQQSSAFKHEQLLY